MKGPKASGGFPPTEFASIRHGMTRQRHTSCTLPDSTCSQAGPNKKARLEACGASITRFFDKAQENQVRCAHLKPVSSAAAALNTSVCDMSRLIPMYVQGKLGHNTSKDDVRQASPGVPADGASPEPRSHRGVACIGARSVLLKHLPALQDMGPIDSVSTPAAVADAAGIGAQQTWASARFASPLPAAAPCRSLR